MTLTTPPTQFAQLNAERTADILRRFDSFELNDAQRTAMAANRDNFKELAARILATTKPGREQSAALTALEEAKYWSNQSIALSGILPREDDEAVQLGEPVTLDVLHARIINDRVEGITTTTIGALLAELLHAVLTEGEGFGRPGGAIGFRGWDDAIDDALAEGGFRTADLYDAITEALTARAAIVVPA